MQHDARTLGVGILKRLAAPRVSSERAVVRHHALALIGSDDRSGNIANACEVDLAGAMRQFDNGHRGASRLAQSVMCPLEYLAGRVSKITMEHSYSFFGSFRSVLS